MINKRCKVIFSRESPYEVVALHPFLEPDFFRTLRDSFSEISDMRFLGAVGNKYSLSDGKRGNFKEFAEHHKEWRDFSRIVRHYTLRNYLKRFFPVLGQTKIKHKIELSALPGDGGHITPHPDTKKKIVTAVIYLADDDWKQEWGGDFCMVSPNIEVSDDEEYPRVNFEDVSLVDSVPFSPNVCVAMRRTPVSFHAVYPINAPADRLRRTITINFMGHL